MLTHAGSIACLWALIRPECAFNDAYRYIDWLLTVPVLLMEIVLTMKISSLSSASPRR